MGGFLQVSPEILRTPETSEHLTRTLSHPNPRSEEEGTVFEVVKVWHLLRIFFLKKYSCDLGILVCIYLFLF